MKFRKRPIEVWAEPIIWGNWSRLWELAEGNIKGRSVDGRLVVDVRTLEGTVTVTEGNWLVRGIRGEVYPVRDDIFRATYEPLDSPVEFGGMLRGAPTPASAQDIQAAHAVAERYDQWVKQMPMTDNQSRVNLNELRTRVLNEASFKGGEGPDKA